MNEAIRHTLKKEERLYLRKEIEALFATRQGKTFYPLRVVVRVVPAGPHSTNNKILISVPKKMLKHAVDRNRIKRLVREAYRLNKHLLLPEDGSDQKAFAHIAFIYLTKELATYPEIVKSVTKSLPFIREQISKLAPTKAKPEPYEESDQ